ncbi:MAG: DNA-3-methyladenine glycosylase I [Melioribacteraceae bacterium]
MEMKLSKENNSCAWHKQKDFMMKYHDEEWGVPCYDDKKHFEFLILESAQAGLSWETILKRRSGYKKAFANFNPKKVAQFDKRKVEELLQDVGIIRNRLKIEAAINNASRFLEIQKEFGSFTNYIWSFNEGKPVINKFNSTKELPATSSLSDLVSKDMKKRGLKFVGSTIIYAHLQATGLINDHEVSCFRYKEVQKLYRN